MSLYLEAAAVLTQPAGSLKSRIYNNPKLKSPPARLYALAVETLKHQELLNEVIDKSGLLALEKKLTHPLALLLLHDHFLTKGGIATSTGPLKTAVLNHKARLSAEFARARLKRGHASSAALLAAASGPTQKLPRWVRVNTLKTSVSAVLEAFPEYELVDSLDGLSSVGTEDKQGRKDTQNRLFKDPHIPSLLAFPPSTDLTAHALYFSGALILQDKASCFPAYLLDPPENAYVIDATAAPGNKTTHLAALLGKGTKGKVIAFEKDRKRGEVLKSMVRKAGADGIVEVRAGEDFLRATPADDEALGKATHILLDPSCSGSGIVGRAEWELLPFPTAAARASVPAKPSNGKKRKRSNTTGTTLPPEPTTALPAAADEEEAQDVHPSVQRLHSLSSFQKSIIQHAMSFPSCRKITYSTCSVHAEENEDVVSAVLASKIARRRGWRTQKRDEGCLREWGRRGDVDRCVDVKDAEACIRCRPVEDGGIGFFVVAFVREGADDSDIDGEDEEQGRNGEENATKKLVMGDEEAEWTGFGAEDTGAAVQEGSGGQRVRKKKRSKQITKKRE